ncbi:MAG: hypothetical protein IJ673_00240 [Treponema sp.]|nr:hypothetical protein [Treponema sp.]
MKSQYDSIKTARELLKDVAVHGLSTREEDMCRVQDIFGHSIIEELAELAHENRDLFYFVAFKIWNWEAATEFWNKHSNTKVEDLEARNIELEAELKKAEAAVVARSEQLKDQMEKELAEKDQEIIRLKARLFDMIEAA